MSEISARENSSGKGAGKTGRRLKNTLGALLFFAAAVFLAWRLLLWNALDCVRYRDYDAAQELSAAIIGAVGGESTVVPMIEALRGARAENGIAENLIHLHRRFGIDREPYLSALADAILGRKTANYNRVQLISVLEAVAGESFGYPMVGTDVVPPGMREQAERGMENVRVWLDRRGGRGKAGKPR
jgi:hypothetical protein